MKKLSSLLFALSLPLLLVSCNNGNNSSGSSSPVSSDFSSDVSQTEAETAHTSSVKSYLKALIKAHNYTLKEEVSSSVSTSVNEATSYYGEDFFYYDANYTLPYGFIRCEEGVYQVQENGGELIGGELLEDSSGNKYQTIWNNYFFYSFADLDEKSVDEIKGDGKANVSITGKKNRTAMLDLLGLGSSYYVSITSFTGTVNEDGTLSLNLAISDSSSGIITVKASVSALSTTFSSKIENYRASKSYFVIDEDFGKARSLMKSNNYTHYYIDDNDKIVGTEYFNENYYFVEWDSDYAAKMANEEGTILYSTGLIAIRGKKIKDSSGTYHTLNGCYLVSLSGSSYSVNLTNYYNESTDIASVYSYPSLLELWNEVELFEETEVDGLDKAFVTDDNNLIEDFVAMFFLTDSVSSVVTENLYVGWKNLDVDGEQMISFTLETTGGSLTYEFYHFGNTFIPALDLFLDDLE